MPVLLSGLSSVLQHSHGKVVPNLRDTLLFALDRLAQEALPHEVFTDEEKADIELLRNKEKSTNDTQNILFRGFLRARKVHQGKFKQEIQSQINSWYKSIDSKEKQLKTILDELCNTLCEMKSQFPFILSTVCDSCFDDRISKGGFKFQWLSCDNSFENTQLANLTLPPEERLDDVVEAPCFFVSLNGGNLLHLPDTKKYLFMTLKEKCLAFPSFCKMLQYIANRYSLLFIGCSEEEDEQQIVELIQHIASEENHHPHFAILPRAENALQSAYHTKLKVIRAPPTIAPTHHLDYVSDMLLLLSKNFTNEDYAPFVAVSELAPSHELFFRPDQRHEYLALQTRMEEQAETIKLATADMSNVVATEEFLQNIIVPDITKRYRDIAQHFSWIYPPGFDEQDYVLNYLFTAMKKRCQQFFSNLPQKSVQLLFFEENMKKTLDAKSKCEIQRYKLLLSFLLKCVKFEMKLIPAKHFQSGFAGDKDKLSFGLVKYKQNTASFFAKTARVAGRNFQKQLISLNNTNAKDRDKLFKVRKY